MQPCQVFVSPSDLVTKVRSVMRSSGLRTLPVVKDGKLTGIVTARQIMRVTSTRSNIPVAGLMISPRVVTTPDENLTKVANDIVQLEVSIVPVVRSGSDQTIIGVVQLGDILRYIAKAPRSKKLTVGKIMSRDVVGCNSDDEIPRVWNVMEETEYSGLPVTRYNKQKHALEVIGMVTRSDIIRSGAARLGEESDKGHFQHPPRVSNIMRTPPIVTSPSTPIAEAVDLMLKHGVGRLPVVEDGALVGIVARSDIVKAWL